MAGRRWALAGMLCALLFCSACSTRTLLKKQKLQVLTNEQQYLVDLDKTLSATPNPEVTSQTSVFISGKTLDKILAAADNVQVPIQQIKGAVFHVDNVRTEFRDNFPIVTIKCWASKPNIKTRVDLVVSAELQPELQPGPPPSLRLNINIIRVVPNVRIGFLKIRLWWFVRDLVHAKLNNFVAGLPKFDLPLRQDFAFDAPPKSLPERIPTPDGYIDGNVDLPGYSVHGAIKIDRLIFLRDGLHVLISTDLSQRAQVTR